MVTGHGMIAKKFASYKSDDNYLIFASGVSNSKNTDLTAFQRETDLLTEMRKLHPDKMLVYFSTFSIFDPSEKDSLYVQHKRKLEDFIVQSEGNYLVLRVSNLAGRSANPNTILNFIYSHIINKLSFQAWMNSTRNLIDIDDLFLTVDYILKNKLFINRIITIANPVNNTVPAIIHAFEKILNLQAIYEPLPKGTPFEIDVSEILPVYRELNIVFDKSYLDNLIKKYYLQQ